MVVKGGGGRGGEEIGGGDSMDRGYYRKCPCPAICHLGPAHRKSVRCYSWQHSLICGGQHRSMLCVPNGHVHDNGHNLEPRIGMDTVNRREMGGGEREGEGGNRDRYKGREDTDFTALYRVKNIFNGKATE